MQTPSLAQYYQAVGKGEKNVFLGLSGHDLFEQGGYLVI